MSYPGYSHPTIMLTLLANLMDFEMATFQSFKVPGIILHGQVTDLALSSRNQEVIQLYLDLVQERYKATPILGTHNFGTLLPKLREWGIKVPVLAPLNRNGFMMKPSPELCEKLLEETDYYIIAKKVLAGGRLTPEEALPYLKDKNISSVVFGIGSLSETYHTLSIAKSFFSGA